ncbi:MAG: restriction endonuclease subunit S [Bacillales bacterium]|nr:restriction endonuclease subunit S [Bacillales bacterium]
MALKRIKLGDYIEQCDEKNTDELFSLEYVKGISTQKYFIETKANMDGVSLKGYKIVRPGCFAYVPDTSRRGDKISLAYNDTNKVILVSSISVVFKVINEKELSSGYLFMYFNRPEFDRYSRYNSFGSAREPFNWEDMCDIEIELPDLPTQEKFVKVYLSMLENQKNYERGLEDLKLVCDGYIEDLRRKMPSKKIGSYIELKRAKNENNVIKDVYGVSNTLKFIQASSMVDKENLSGYKIVEYQDIAYVPTTHMKIWAAAISNCNKPFVVSPIYEVFTIKDKNKLCPDFLFMWLCRKETIRYAYYNSWGSARENFVFDDMRAVKMPMPNIDDQQSIVNIYKCYQDRKDINEKLKQQIKDICPILIKGSIEEAKEV